MLPGMRHMSMSMCIVHVESENVRHDNPESASPTFNTECRVRSARSQRQRRRTASGTRSRRLAKRRLPFQSGRVCFFPSQPNPSHHFSIASHHRIPILTAPPLFVSPTGHRRAAARRRQCAAGRQHGASSHLNLCRRSISGVQYTFRVIARCAVS